MLSSELQLSDLTICQGSRRGELFKQVKTLAARRTVTEMGWAGLTEDSSTSEILLSLVMEADIAECTLRFQAHDQVTPLRSQNSTNPQLVNQLSFQLQGTSTQPCALCLYQRKRQPSVEIRGSACRDEVVRWGLLITTLLSPSGGGDAGNGSRFRVSLRAAYSALNPSEPQRHLTPHFDSYRPDRRAQRERREAGERDRNSDGQDFSFSPALLRNMLLFKLALLCVMELRASVTASGSSPTVRTAAPPVAASPGGRHGLRRKHGIVHSIDQIYHGDGKIGYIVYADGKKFLLDLERDESVLSPHFSTQYVDALQGSKHGRPPHKECVYRGTVDSRPESLALFNLCGGLKGFFAVRHGRYTLRPLLRAKGHENGVYREESDRALHLYTRESFRFEAVSTGESCGTRGGAGKAEQHHGALGNGGHRGRGRDGHDAHGEEAWWFARPLAHTPPGRQRTRRSVSRARHVELLLVADGSMTQKYGDDLEHYLLTLASIASKLYGHASIENPIRLSVVKVVVVTDKEKGLEISKNAAATLKSFCKWQNQQNPLDDDHQEHHDAAILFTRQPCNCFLHVLFWAAIPAFGVRKAIPPPSPGIAPSRSSDMPVAVLVVSSAVGTEPCLFWSEWGPVTFTAEWSGMQSGTLVGVSRSVALESAVRSSRVGTVTVPHVTPLPAASCFGQREGELPLVRVSEPRACPRAGVPPVIAQAPLDSVAGRGVLEHEPQSSSCVALHENPLAHWEPRLVLTATRSAWSHVGCILQGMPAQPLPGSLDLRCCLHLPDHTRCRPSTTNSQPPQKQAGNWHHSHPSFTAWVPPGLLSGCGDSKWVRLQGVLLCGGCKNGTSLPPPPLSGEDYRSVVFHPQCRVRRQRRPWGPLLIDCACVDVEASNHGGWSSWGPWGQCSQTCGGGVQFAHRQCNNPSPRNNGRYCTGKRAVYRSCNGRGGAEGAPSLSHCHCPLYTLCPGKSFRHEQCEARNGYQSDPKGVKTFVEWVPKFAGVLPGDVCKLTCRAKGTGYYVVFSQKCGVCGGDSSDCIKVVGNFTKKRPDLVSATLSCPHGPLSSTVQQTPLRAGGQSRERRKHSTEIIIYCLYNCPSPSERGEKCHGGQRLRVTDPRLHGSPCSAPQPCPA
ncbi:ATS5 metalloproteinase, partial [Atractosteus spatula]|nr:ATS5 metalloproteinase [Atractosteus spatula]